MATYIVTSTAFLPDSNTTVGSARVEISDHHMAALRALVNEVGTTDVGVLDLEHEMPALYDILKEACEVATTPAVEAYYLRKFYCEGRINYNVDEVKYRCEAAGFYTYDVGVDAFMYDQDPNQALMEQECNNRIFFEEWLPGYIDSLDDLEFIDFMANIMDYEMTDLGEWEFTIEVPDTLKR